MKKRLCVLGMIVMALGAAVNVYADDNEYVPGVTVEEDADSPTGYTAVFIYEDEKAETVKLSGSFGMATDEHEQGVEPEYTSPHEWQDGMFPIGQETYSEEMEKVEGTDLWIDKLPLPSGHYQYCFYVDDSETRVYDPTNPPSASSVEGGGAYTRSVFDVPYDEEKQPNETDFSFAAKRTDDQKGEVSYVAYEDLSGETRSMGVYLPYGYDAEREEGYKVLYLAHGTGGNEAFWFGGGAAAEIFDNLIAEGTTEPTIVVTMNAELYLAEGEEFEWDYDMCIDNIMNAIIPYIEENYNVDTNPESRAFAGLSRGAMLATKVYFDHAKDFNYFGFFSGAMNKLDWENADTEELAEPDIMMGCGIYDFALNMDGLSMETFDATMTELGIEHSVLKVNGAHEWFTWMQLLYNFAGEHLWK